MKIALIGYGKMGQEIEKIAVERGHLIGAKLTVEDEGFGVESLVGCDVAIDFTVPESAVHNIRTCFEAKVPVVVGTTGWYKQWESVVGDCDELKGGLLCATNFSIGVNIFFEINKQLAALLGPHGYDVSMKEVHHTEKLDAPSGTAISLAEGIIENHGVKQKWVNNSTEADDTVGIESVRLPNVPGTHVVKYENEIDQITIEHEAKNRRGFALGAVVAAEFLQNKVGVFSMQDVLRIGAK